MMSRPVCLVAHRRLVRQSTAGHYRPIRRPHLQPLWMPQRSHTLGCTPWKQLCSQLLARQLWLEVALPFKFPTPSCLMIHRQRDS